MPQVPLNPTATSPSVMQQQPSPENLLMAAAAVHQESQQEPAYTIPTGSKGQPNPSRPHRIKRRLRVVK